jgi:hypothetical protein
VSLGCTDEIRQADEPAWEPLGTARERVLNALYMGNPDFDITQIDTQDATLVIGHLVLSYQNLLVP